MKIAIANDIFSVSLNDCTVVFSFQTGQFSEIDGKANEVWRELLSSKCLNVTDENSEIARLLCELGLVDEIHS